MASMCQPSKNLPVVADQNEEISGDNWEEEEEFDEGDAVFSSDECEDVADKDEDAEQKEKGGDSMDFQEDTKPQQPEGKGRIKRQCPVPYCKKKVVHIPRHLVNVHGWSYSRSRAAVTQFNLRKKYTFKSQETAEAGNRKKKQTLLDEKAPKAYKDYHKKRICPMLGCSACVKRLPAHLKNVHGISPGSDDLKSLLKKALPKRERPYSVQLIEKRSSGERLTKSEELFLEKKAEVL